MNNNQKKYLHDCKRVFPFISTNEKVFFNKFVENVNEHASNDENATYQDFIEKIGSPKDIMISYIQDCEDSYIIDKMNSKKLIKRIFVTISVVLIMGLSIVCYYEWETVQEIKNQKVITEETEVEQNIE